jgi:hypothetical protein
MKKSGNFPVDSIALTFFPKKQENIRFTTGGFFCIMRKMWKYAHRLSLREGFYEILT